ncbi:uncharacterized protein [Battus philenor]|uniref:uncharacterized protein n=1 Tax=Battus philenor TaxID=42288 RepID=UPI0035CF7411
MSCEGHGKSTTCELLSAKQLQHVVQRVLGEPGWRVAACDRRPAAAGMVGFLGDHARVTVHVRLNGAVKKLRLFVKSLPASNAPKAEFIQKYGYSKREALALNLSEEMRGAEGPNPWCAPVYLCNESVLVMPDLALQGYRTLHNQHTVDLQHALLAAAAVARFHAAYANYATARSRREHRPYSFLQEHADVLKEHTLCESPWLRAAAKLTANFLKAFSAKYEQFPRDLEQQLVQRYLESCATLTEYTDTLNVLLHRDLWVNNIMFRYDGDEPTNALLIDFQCLRYGPPAFDLMAFLYLATGQKFRERHEAALLRHYYDAFAAAVDRDTRERLQELQYDFSALADWCERSRMFAAFMALGILPFVLMDPLIAQKTFDDPATFTRYCDEDRTEPVLAYCRVSPVYMQRQLEIAEEFVERFVIKQP